MNRNNLKFIACVSMLVDHIGYFLFPEIQVLRWIGRLAFPLFAFFIGEGSRYTHNRKKYFLQVLALGIGCQAVYFIEEIIEGNGIGLSSGCWYLNILLTFAVAIVGCYCLLDYKNEKSTATKAKLAAFTVIAVTVLAGSEVLHNLTSSEFQFDYGISGILIPIAVCLFDDKKKKLTAYTIAVIIYCILFIPKMPYAWFSLLTVPMLIAYNSKAGSKKFKYAFYIFYPVHIALIYLVQMLFFS